MSSNEKIHQMKNIFSGLFIVAQRWKNIGDRYLSNDNLTTMQWLLMAVLVNVFNDPPTLSEAAEAMGSSRQNVKQIALKLERMGFLRFVADEKDNRAQRLQLTGASEEFWVKRIDRDNENVSVLFTGLSEDEVDQLYSIMRKLERQTTKMDNPGRWQDLK